MKNKYIYPQAVDISTKYQPPIIEPRGGLTLREHFAGLAMQGLVGSAKSGSSQAVIEVSIKLADALIKALED